MVVIDQQNNKHQDPHQGLMIMTQTEANAFAAYLRSARTTSQSQVDASATPAKYRYDTAHTNTRHVPSAH